MKPSPFVALLLGLALALASCGQRAADDAEVGGPLPAAGPRPDVAVVLIDTLRQDHLDLYGYPKETAPYLRRLAEGSAVFERAYSTSSWTAPATATVFTGLYPPRHGVTLGYNAYGKEDEVEGAQTEDEAGTLSKLPSGLATLGELFAGHGYQTYAVASNVNVSEERGFQRGFERFERTVKAHAEDLRTSLAGWAAERDAERPAFWYLHFNDVHKPYERRDPWYVEGGNKMANAKARYDSEIRYLDEVLATLEDVLGWGPETVICVLSDHGEEFGDHGMTGHRYRLYGELMNVPLLLRAPGLTDAGPRLDSPVSLIDVLPTLADLLGFADQHPRDGVSLMPLLRGRELAPRPLFAQRRKPNHEPILWAVVDGGWKLIYSEEGERFELFDAVNDPLDQQDLAAQHPEQVQRLRELLEPMRAVQPLDAESLQQDQSEAMLQHLREMGYAGDDEDEDQ